MLTDNILQTIWRNILAKAEINDRAWLSSLVPFILEGNVFTCEAPNDFTKSRVEHRIRPWLEEQLSHHLGEPIKLQIEVNQSLQENKFIDDFPAEVIHDDFVKTENPLNPRYTFDTFVPAPSNNFAYSAALRVAESPSTAFNPLMIYGGSGLGKTHLLHAIGHYVHEYHPHLVVKYVSTEQMTNDFINAIDKSSMDEFRQQYRRVDVLLVDDIQFLEKKIQTQEEFFHTFNTLHMAQKQIVLTSDRKPSALELLEDRLKSRFEWGLTSDVQPPDIETRIAILRRKAGADNLDIPADVLEFIASHNFTNIRELEGCLIRVSAFASLNNLPVDMEVCRDVLRDFSYDENTVVDPKTIMSRTADFYGVSVAELMGPGRTANVAMARQVAMYLCREMTEISFPKIGQLFKRDHTTVMHGERRIREMISTNRVVYNQITELTNKIRKG